MSEFSFFWLNSLIVNANMPKRGQIKFMLIKAVTPMPLVLNCVLTDLYLFISVFIFHILPHEADLAGTL